MSLRQRSEFHVHSGDEDIELAMQTLAAAEAILFNDGSDDKVFSYGGGFHDEASSALATSRSPRG